MNDNLVPGIFINGTSEGNYISPNEIISSSGIAVYDEFIRSLSYTTPGNTYTGNDYIDLDLGCKTIDPCCYAENLCDSNANNTKATDSQGRFSECSPYADVTISDNMPPISRPGLMAPTGRGREII